MLSRSEARERVFRGTATRADAVRGVEAGCPDGEERVGLRIRRRATEAPARQIADNPEAAPVVVVSAVLAGQRNAEFDAGTGTCVGLVAAGIIIPTKVVRVALEHVASAAGTLVIPRPA